MIVYAAILFVLAVTLFIWGCSLYSGNLNSMRANHQRMVKNKVAYGKAAGKALFTMAISQALAGVIALLGEETPYIILTIIVSFIGLILGICCVNKVREELINCEF